MILRGDNEIEAAVQLLDVQLRVEVSRLGCGLHNHNLTEIDAAKRNTAIRGLPADEVAKGYKPENSIILASIVGGKKTRI